MSEPLTIEGWCRRVESCEPRGLDESDAQVARWLRGLLAKLEEKEDQIHRLREVRDDLADALHELECGWWATGTVPEMMEAVRVIVRGTVDRATEGTP